MVVGQAEDVSPLPEAIARMYEFQMGTWKVEGTVGEQPATARWSCRWAPGKHCYLVAGAANSLDKEASKTPSTAAWLSFRNMVYVSCGRN